VHDPGAVCRVQRARQLSRDRQRLGNRQGATLQPDVQSVAVDELHDEGERARSSRKIGWYLFDPVNLRDVLMVERGQDLCLAPKSREPLVVVRDIRGQHLDGDIPVQAQVARTVHGAHAAFAELGEDLEGAELCARSRGGHERGRL
jgi:hypothetical protein